MPDLTPKLVTQPFWMQTSRTIDFNCNQQCEKIFSILQSQIFATVLRISQLIFSTKTFSPKFLNYFFLSSKLQFLKHISQLLILGLSWHAQPRTIRSFFILSLKRSKSFGTEILTALVWGPKRIPICCISRDDSLKMLSYETNTEIPISHRAVDSSDKKLGINSPY